jgi:hypothetical protein
MIEVVVVFSRQRESDRLEAICSTEEAANKWIDHNENRFADGCYIEKWSVSDGR